MAGYTHLERRAGMIIFVTGLLFGVSLVLAFLGFFWWPLSLVVVPLVIGVHRLSSRGRALDFDPWLTGASGESQVRNALMELESIGYVIVGDVDIGRGNIDHVVVGPTGVFAIETKNQGGRVRSKEGRLLLNGWPVEHRRQAVNAAIWVRNRLALRYVEALLVYPSAAVEGDVIRFSNVTVLALPRLNAEITSKVSSLDAGEINVIVQKLLTASPAAAG